jgi:threonine aldolase
MNFASDNTAGVSEPIMMALAAANQGFAPSYGADDLTAGVKRRLAEVFEREVEVYLVATGTAANALSISTFAEPWTAVLCSHNAHVLTDECGAVEMFSAGARLVGVDGDHAKIDVAALADLLDHWPSGRPHVVQPSGLSISQASEFGAVWSPDDVGALGEIARRHGLRLHMDGARFANAVAALDCAPADVTWRAGVDILSFGATKNGALGAEAIVVFAPELARTLTKRRMRAGQLISKGRFVAAQLLAYLEKDHWLDLAAHANAMAMRLGKGIAASTSARLAVPVEANEVFAWLAAVDVARLREEGAMFYEWQGAASGVDSAGVPSDARLVRFVASFATDEGQVDRLLGLLGTGKDRVAAQ